VFFLILRFTAWNRPAAGSQSLSVYSFLFLLAAGVLSLGEEIPAGLGGFLRGRPWSSLPLVHWVKICFLPPA
jgi:hypothetical protein